MLQVLCLKIIITWIDCSWKLKEFFVWKSCQLILLFIPLLRFSCHTKRNMLRIHTSSPWMSKTVCFNPIFYLQRRRYMFSPAARVRLSVCVQDYSETRAWIWMKCCVSTDVGTWTNWLTFESDPDHSPDARTGLFSPIAYALQLGILLPGTSGKSHVLVLGACRSSDA